MKQRHPKLKTQRLSREAGVSLCGRAGEGQVSGPWCTRWGGMKLVAR